MTPLFVWFKTGFELKVFYRCFLHKFGLYELKVWFELFCWVFIFASPFVAPLCVSFPPSPHMSNHGSHVPKQDACTSRHYLLSYKVD